MMFLTEIQIILVLASHVSFTSRVMTECATTITEVHVRASARAYIHYQAIVRWMALWNRDGIRMGSATVVVEGCFSYVVHSNEF